MNPIDESLDQQLQALPRAVEPPQDLWPAIQAAIQPARRPRWPLALAASVAVAITGSLYAWKLLHAGRPALPGEIVSAPVSAVSFASPQQPAYLRAHAQLERLFRERLQLLRPETRAKVEANLRIIRTADDNIRRALENDPASPLLLELLENNQQQEINLYVSVVRNTEPQLSGS
jgi:hypothetical protein